MVEVRQARFFVAVAEELHFGRAAERLSMSQPPLSQAILQLERQLGTQLLYRSSRKVLLTETGRLFLEECRILIRASEKAREVAEQAELGLVGSLRIGAVASAFTEALPPILQRLRQARPLIELHVQEIDTHNGRDALLHRTLDIAVIRQSRPGPGLKSLPIRQDHFVIAVPKDHPWAAHDGPAALKDFRDESWVWLARHVSPDDHDELVAACRASGFSPEPRHYANSIDSQLTMVECGLGVTLVPESFVRRRHRALNWSDLRNRVDFVELSVVYRADGRDPLVEQFLAFAAPRK